MPLFIIIIIGVIWTGYMVVSWAITLKTLNPSDRRFKLLSLNVGGGIICWIWIVFGHGVIDYHGLALILTGVLVRLTKQEKKLA